MRREVDHGLEALLGEQARTSSPVADVARDDLRRAGAARVGALDARDRRSR
jgi:hypothetical protein